ncbi:MAG TPA: serpin family protein [Tepidisphaeraceae bacterium]|jgi:serpin B
MRLAAILAVILVVANRGMSALAPDGPGLGLSSAAEAIDRFSVDLYGHTAAGDGNLVLSPLSVYSALMMTGAGAREGTAREMSAALGVSDVASAEVQAAEGALLGRIGKSDQDFQLHIASAIWAQEGFKCLPGFESILENDYQAKVMGTDFHDPSRASGAINDWVAKETSGKIADLFSPGSIAPDTRMVLANAIYFKADWESPFLAHLTRDGDFHVGGQAKGTPTPMMHRSGLFLSSQNDQVQAIELPYKGGTVAMTILLPRSVDGLASLESGLSAKFLNDVETGMQREAVEVAIPKFKFSAEFGLAEKLKEMGMGSAFTPGRADFSGIGGQADVYISKVQHKAFIAVDEQGTEAAAATGIVMAPTAVFMSRMTFTADHPFLFMIRDKSSGAILFLGRVENPKG